MFPLLAVSIGLRFLRRVWVFALVALGGYALGARSSTPPVQMAAAGAPRLAKHSDAGFIKAPGFHFHD
jgi:hypothetical protein